MDRKSEEDFFKGFEVKDGPTVIRFDIPVSPVDPDYADMLKFCQNWPHPWAPTREFSDRFKGVRFVFAVPGPNGVCEVIAVRESGVKGHVASCVLANGRSTGTLTIEAFVDDENVVRDGTVDIVGIPVLGTDGKLFGTEADGGTFPNAKKAAEYASGLIGMSRSGNKRYHDRIVRTNENKRFLKVDRELRRIAMNFGDLKGL
jgi:hypothetical protein